MTTIFYAHETTGAYLGGVDSAEAAPANSVVVPTAPDHALMVWDGTAWGGFDSPQPQDLTRTIAVKYGLYNDTDVPWQIFSFCDAIRFGGGSQTLRQAVWARLKVDNPDWLTQAFKDKFVQWAADANMPVE